MKIGFGIPQKRVRKSKEVKYPGKAWVKMVVQPMENGAYKFELNEEAIDALGFSLDGTDTVALGFVDGNVYIANGEGVDRGIYRVAKQGSFSNSKLYGYVRDYLSLDVSVENYFEIKTVDEIENALLMSLLSEDAGAPQETNETETTTDNTSEVEAQSQIEVEEQVEQIIY